jgi:hypothetical protein
VVSEVEENLGVAVGLEDWSWSGGITGKNLDDVGSGGVALGVVNLATLIDINSLGA